jgi:hypothetical protein
LIITEKGHVLILTDKIKKQNGNQILAKGRDELFIPKLSHLEITSNGCVYSKYHFPLSPLFRSLLTI